MSEIDTIDRSDQAGVRRVHESHHLPWKEASFGRRGAVGLKAEFRETGRLEPIDRRGLTGFTGWPSGRSPAGFKPKGTEK